MTGYPRETRGPGVGAPQGPAHVPAIQEGALSSRDADNTATRAEQTWKDLLAAQAGSRDLLGEARTELYLSQLCFLRWQRRAMRNAAAHIKQYHKTYAAFQKDLTDHRRRVQNIMTNSKTIKRKTPANSVCCSPS